ncbi:MAG: alpha/beta hydrolase family protein [Chryseolinea sp.]
MGITNWSLRWWVTISFLIFGLLSVTDSSLAQTTKEMTPPFVVPKSLADWQKMRTGIRDTLVKLMGDLPPIPTKTPVKILGTEDKGSYTIEKFEFENGAGAIVPGVLLKPKTGLKKYPAIYYSHWHGGNYDLGKRELFSTHHTPQVPADVLTQLGYIVIAIDAYGFGERSGKGPGGPEEIGGSEELSESKYQLWLGRSLWSMMVRDDRMALNYLFTRPDVDVTRVAATGISMGATRTWWLMALDERIKAGVAVGCMTRYQNLIDEHKLKAHGIYYFVPGILKHFDTEAIISMIAPRPILFMTGDEDIGSPVSGIKSLEAPVKSIYKLNGTESSFQSIIYEHTGHVYTPDMWERMTKWMMVNLK